MEWIKKWLRLACESYTVAAMLLLFLSIAFSDGAADKGISVRAFLFIFAFAAAFAFAQLQFLYAPLSKFLRLIFHFLLTLSAAFLFLYLPNNPTSSGSGKLLMFLLLAVVYWILMGAYLAICKKGQSAPKGETPYRGVYKKD